MKTQHAVILLGI